VRCGMKVDDLPTPALLADMNRVERNLHQMASFLEGGAVRLRPHFKAHQVLSLAKRQLQLGAIGVTCANLDQAETLVGGAIDNVLIASEIAGEQKLRRFADLSRRASVIVAVDNAKVVSELASVARHGQPKLNVLVDVDVRLGRSGVKPGEAALALARKVVESGLRFRGLMGYEGQVSLSPGPERDLIVKNALRQLTQTRAMIEHAGIPVEIASCGGTSDYAAAARHPGVTEIQAGSYLLMDSTYLTFAPEFEAAVSVIATVISKTPGERIVLDAGLTSMSSENGLESIKARPGFRVKVINVEHTVVEITDPTIAVEVGDRMEVSVGFIDQTLALHPFLYGVRDGLIEEVMKIER
jgi:D-serine deaminase-like pyridoxal phosphate-dependent protein